MNIYDLGYADSIELREQLMHTNVAFATEIVDMQEIDTTAINKVMDSIANIQGKSYKPSKYISTTLIPPVILILQLIEMTLSSVGNISGVFQNMGMTIDPYFFLSQYVPHIDWDKFKEASDAKTVIDKAKANINMATGDQSGGGGGVF